MANQIFMRVDEVAEELGVVWGLDHAENELWKQPPDPVLEAVAKIVPHRLCVAPSQQCAGAGGVCKKASKERISFHNSDKA